MNEVLFEDVTALTCNINYFHRNIGLQLEFYNSIRYNADWLIRLPADLNRLYENDESLTLGHATIH